MATHRIRAQIVDNFTRTAAAHVRKGDLTGYSADENFIYQLITDEDYARRIAREENEPFMMKEIGVEATYDFNYGK